MDVILQLLVLMWTIVRKTYGSCGFRKDMPYDSMGNDASVGEFPWQVTVKLGSNHFCSGTIISEFWVLSSAECFAEKPDTLIMEVGVINLGTGRNYPLRKLVIHNEYHGNASENNLALLESSEPISYSDMVQPACFPDDHLLSIDYLSNCWVTTWREKIQDEPNNIETVLKKLPLIPAMPCHFKTMVKIVCAGTGDVAESSDCTVSSGDALMCQYVENKAWTVVGIVSIKSSECNSTVIFTRTASYISWIKENTEAEGKPVIPEINLGDSEEKLQNEELTNYTLYTYEDIAPLVIEVNNSSFEETVNNNKESALEAENMIVIVVLCFIIAMYSM